MVATSDALEQIIIRGKGAALLSARELKEEIQRVNNAAMQAYEKKHSMKPSYLADELSADTKDRIIKYINEENE